MGLFDHFPYTNIHEMNLDWIMQMMKALEAAWKEFVAGNSLVFADPLLHDLTKTYAKNTIVLDENGNAYLSLKAVPVGVSLSNTEYWLMVFDYEAFLEKVNKNFTDRYYRDENRAKTAMSVGDWLTLDDVLYKVTAAIAVDELLEEDVNIEHFTLEDFIKAFMQSATNLIQQYKNDIDASELAFTNYLQDQFDQVLAGVTVDSEVINARVGYNGVTYSTLGNAIRSQVESLENKTTAINNTDRYGISNRNYNRRYPLSLTDDDANSILNITAFGSLETKKFDSSYVDIFRSFFCPTDYDFAICDDSGNAALSIIKGIINGNQCLSGKKVSIIGDSISTYDGYIPSGYVTYYPDGNLNNVNKTWWMQLIKELDLELLVNASWSGSTVSGDSQGSAKVACSDARISDLTDGLDNPNIIFIYIGTNDWYNNIEVGSFTNHDDIPSDGVITEISKAYALMLYKIRNSYPDAHIYCFTNLEGRAASGDNTYPFINTQGETIHDVNHAIIEIAHIFGCDVIDLECCGIHYWNVSSYTVDGKLHPNTAGHEIIKEVVKDALLNTYHNM